MGPPSAGGVAVPSRQPHNRAQTNGTPPPESHTEQFTAVSGEQDPTRNGYPARPPVEDEPPAGLAGWRQRRRAAQLEDTQAGMPPVAADPRDAEPEPAGVRAPDVGPPTQGFPAPSPLVDEEADLDDEAFADDWYRDRRRHHEFDAGDEGVDDEYEGEPSPGRQWLTMAGQLALGVVAGAAVWLGFNWLWGQIPAAGLIAALVVIAGLVWIVRKIRRVDDLQTTVIAVLVGLVVTVSPAALLLLAR